MQEISMKKAKDLLNNFLDTNKALEERGLDPIAVCLEATAGIGKTSIIKEVAEERGMQFVKLNLSQLEEVGDLIGFPQTEFECEVGKITKTEDGKTVIKPLGKTVWLNAKQMDSPTPGLKYRQTGKTRMGYAKPSWVPEYDENGTVFLIDDFTRANNTLLNAMMDLVWEHKYVSWTLPKGTTTFLTSNPDNGQYNVSSIDEAVRTRFLGYDVAFDLDSWAEWAEKRGMDGRCINFVMSYSNELFKKDDEGNGICNPRSFTMFSDAISTIKDWNNADSMAMINLIAAGCFKDEGGRFGKMFSAFIRNNMHMLVQPKQILQDSWEKVKSILEKTLYDDITDKHSWRPDIASLLEKRFTNYVNAWLDGKDKTPIKTVQDRIMNFIKYEEETGRQLFNKEMYYHMIKSITSDHKNQTNKLLFEPKIAKMIS